MRIISTLCACMFFLFACSSSNNDKKAEKELQEQENEAIETKNKSSESQKKLASVVENFQWFGQSSIRYTTKTGKEIFFDPNFLKPTDSADIIFITHSHQDHLLAPEISKINTPETKIYAPADCCQKLKEAGINNTIEVKPGEEYKIDDEITIKTVPAYNIVKTKFHPKENNWVGYVLNVDGVKIYHAGDTEKIPEMDTIDCDICFIPLGQTYTMESVENAAKAVLAIKAKIAIPFHYGMYEGTEEDALKFKDLLKDKIEVVLLEVVK